MDDTPIAFDEPMNNIKQVTEIKQDGPVNEFPSSMNDYFEQKQGSDIPEETYPPPINYSSSKQEYYQPTHNEEPVKSSQQRILGIPVVVIFIFLLTVIIALGGYALYKSIEKRSSKFKDPQENVDTTKKTTPLIDGLKQE